MKKSDLLKYGDSVVRILEVGDGSALIVDCVHKSMPKWVSLSEFDSYESCGESELLSATGKIIYDYDSLSREDRRFVHERFTLIAGILPFISDEKQRCAMTTSIAETKVVSKQTIRNYLWLYLAYQNIAVLAPKQKQGNRPLTQDEKNMRWALNKFFYTATKTV